MSDAFLECILCGMANIKLSLHAHRNKDNRVVGFVVVCDDCQQGADKYNIVLVHQNETPAGPIDATPDR